jgi:hypothetical protein
MKSVRLIQPLAYLIGGGSLAWVVVLRMLLIVWGVPLHPVLFVALLSAITVIAGGVVSFFRPKLGRIIAVSGLLGLLSIWVPWIMSIVPQPRTIPSPLGYVAVLGYLALLAFALFYPTRSRLGVSLFVVVCLCGVVTAGATYEHRRQQGDYARPSIACFRWSAVPASELQVTRDPEGCVDPEVKSALDRAHIVGRISWTGGSTEGPNRILVLAQSKPPPDSRLFYPRHGLIVYAFDGKVWTKFPQDAATYPLYSTFETSDSDTMICSDDIDGGRTCTAAFRW